MEGILEIKDILDKFAPREKKAAKKFFSRHYRNTKELKLLNLIEYAGSDERIDLENRICKLGYESTTCKSFNKLRNRLKQKLFDYMSSSISISEIRNIDSHSYLKHRLNKMIFQSEVLIEKGLYIQATDLLRTSLRLSQEYEQFSQIVESMEKLRKVHDIQSTLEKEDNIISKIIHFQSILKKYISIESKFNSLILVINTQSLDHLDSKIEDLLKEIQIDPSLLRFSRIQLFRDYLLILKYQHCNNYNSAISLVISQLKLFRNESMKFDVLYKMMYYTAFIELLSLLNHENYAQYFIKHRSVVSKPQHYKMRLNNIENYLSLIQYSKNRLPGILEKLNFESQDPLVKYFQCHRNFLLNKFKKSLLLIDEHIRSYPISSIQQLDLMVLDLLCNFEMRRYDLLEYKMQSYLKNLAYRSKFEIPVYYHIIHKILQLMLRSKAGRIELELQENLHKLNQSAINGLFTHRSLQPTLFSHWARKKLNQVKENIPLIVRKTEINEAPLHQVA